MSRSNSKSKIQRVRQLHEPQNAKSSPARSDDTIKDTIEAIVIAFVLAFVFRAYVVEAFVIPTGSMAPTLLGEHIRVTCDQCGYQFAADPPKAVRQEMSRTRNGQSLVYSRNWINAPSFGNPNRHYQTAGLEAICPMCQYANNVARGTRISSGDRILVQKFVYNFNKPNRWDVVVFKAPHQPTTNYIKRLVGLPNESLLIIGGNIYVKSNDPAASEEKRSWHIARKTDPMENPHAYAIQRAVWQPVYHSNYLPLDQGRNKNSSLQRWHVPWNPEAADSVHWALKNRRNYRFSSSGKGIIRFNFQSQLGEQRKLYVYNQWKVPQQPLDEPIEDVRIAATVVPDEDGLSVWLQTTLRMDDPDFGTRQVRALFADEGQVDLQLKHPDRKQWQSLLSDLIKIEPFAPDRAYRIELWHVDQELTIWIDGQLKLQHRYDLPIQTVIERPPATSFPTVRIGVSGSPVTLYHVQVDRDIYYSTRNSALGGITKTRLAGPVAYPQDQAVKLGGDHHFFLGDNSPSSADSRYWGELNPWIKHRKFDDQSQIGVVPRRLIMGQAFSVYWPDEHRLSPNHYGIFPNFGQMRFIH